MTFIKKLDNDVLFAFMKDYAKKYNQFTPPPGFLSPYFGVTVQCIHQKLNILEKRGLIKQIKRKKNNIAYIIL